MRSLDSLKFCIRPADRASDPIRLLTLSVAAASLASLLLLDPIPQDVQYHDFADQRPLFGIRNGLNVLSNVGFLMAGTFGLKTSSTAAVGAMRIAWMVLFAGVTFVAFGSGYYHLVPDNQPLVWDRLPITVGFMGLLSAVVGEYIGERVGRVLLVPAVLFGMLSVFYWQLTNDLRLYIWVQIFSLLTVLILALLFHSRYSHRWLLVAALGLYALAKVAEAHDQQIFVTTREITSGHTAKHVLAALGCFAIVLMLRLRFTASREHQSG